MSVSGLQGAGMEMRNCLHGVECLGRSLPSFEGLRSKLAISSVQFQAGSYQWKEFT